MTTITIVLDNRRKNSLGNYWVKIRVTHNRQQKYYQTGVKLNLIDFKEVMKSNPPKVFKTVKIELEEILLKAKVAAKGLVSFSFIGFEREFLSTKKQVETLFEIYHRVIKEKTAAGSISTAINYRCSMNSLKEFDDRQVQLVDITPELLTNYENWFLAKGKSITTVGIYLRPLRAIINEAISLGYMIKEQYPFGKRKYIIPEGKNPKKALSVDEFKKLWSYLPDDPYGFEARAKDFFLLSYLCQGMNFKDLIMLRKEQLSDSMIHFVRQKTQLTGRSNPVLVTVPLLKETIEIIDKWRNADPENPFVFGFITPLHTPSEIYTINQQFVQITNKHLMNITQKLQINKKLTTYVARHQFSKAVIEGGETIEYLSQCLGHKSVRTTQYYIQTVELDKKISTAKRILLPEID